ncbi:MAG TPA: transposase [Vicinamibacterales bacterium]|nr:transposase [Vicinamibacterales bacterium]
MRHKPVPRLAGCPYTGLCRYSLTICTHRRQLVFVTRQAVDLVLLQLLQAAHRSSFAVIAYCFMPDHLHLLVEGTEQEAALREFIRVFKQCAAYHWKAEFGSQLWQRSYFDHVLRDGESPDKAARYILANPLRAGLVSRVEDYPYLGSATMSIGELLESIRDDQT